MSGNEQRLRDMLLAVARALPEDLRARMAFVGGSTTALLVTDPVTLEGVRYTQDVDLIVRTEGRGHWVRILERLRESGFRESPEDDVICRMRLGDLKVDFMPDDEAILGFTNRWYRPALDSARPHALSADTQIQLLDPAYFVATKLEAYNGRGNADPMSSHDLEDILTLTDGRESLVGEIMAANPEVRAYIGEEITRLLGHPDFENTVNGNLTDPGRADLVWQRLQAIAGKQGTG